MSAATLLFAGLLAQADGGVPAPGFRPIAQLSGPRKVAVLLFTFRDRQDIRPAEEVRRIFFTGARSANAYFSEVSYGAVSLVGKQRLDGDVFGPFAVDADLGNEPCFSNRHNPKARATAVAGGVDPTGYDHLVYYYPSTNMCPGGGSAAVPSTVSQLYGASEHVVAHELGHNLGLGHTFVRACKAPDGTAVSLGGTCQDYEFQDRFDLMGRAQEYRHFSAYHKAALGWLAGTDITNVHQSGRFTLFAHERRAPGPMMLRIPYTGGESLFVELRRSFGFDAIPAGDPALTGVMVRLAPDNAARAVVKLLDMSPATPAVSDPALPLHHTFRASDGAVALTLSALEDGRAEVTVTIGAAGADAASVSTDAGASPTFAADAAPDARESQQRTDAGTTDGPAQDAPTELGHPAGCQCALAEAERPSVVWAFGMAVALACRRWTRRIVRRS